MKFDQPNPDQPNAHLVLSHGSTKADYPSAVLDDTVSPVGATGLLEEEQLSIGEIWRLILRRKWIIIIFFLMVMLTVTTVTLLITPVYRASLIMQIDQEGTQVVEYQSLTSESSSYAKDFYETQYALLRSRSLAERVINQLSLAKNPAFWDPEKQSFWQPMVAWIKESFRPRPTSADNRINPDLTDLFLDNLDVEPVRNSRLVKIYYSNTDPQLAARIVNKVATEFISLSLERRFESSAYAKKYLEDRIAQLKVRLEESERELIDYARQQQIINVADRKNIAKIALEELNSALSKAEASRIQAESLYQQAQVSKGLNLSKVLENKVIQDLKTFKSNLETEYQENLKVFKPAYPKMQQLLSQIAQVQSKIEQETGILNGGLKADYEAAKVNETLLRGKLEQLKQEVLQLEDRSIEYNILQREVDTNRELYNGLLQRYKEVGVVAGIGLNNFSVIDEAEVPTEPFKPSVKLNLILAIMLGLFGGIALAFLVEHLDDTITQPDQLERYFNIPVLGLIPLEKQRQQDESDIPLALSAQADTRSAFAEAYRSARTALQFSTSEGTPNILVVTSAVPSEGKTTTALTLAINYAQIGKKVLLIDADLRKPSLHRSMKLDNSQGLSAYLAGSAKPGEVTQPTIITNLFTIPAGTLPPNPAELLSSARMVSLLTLATEKFEQIIIDAPPILGLADALILGNLAAGTIIVIEANSTGRNHLKNAIKRMRSAKSHIIGGIITKIGSSGSYGYYHSYQSYYYYYHEDSSKKRLTAT